MKEKLTDIDFDEQIDMEATGIWVLDTSHCVPSWTPLFAWYWGSFCDFGGNGAMEKISQPYARSIAMRLRRGGVYYGFLLAEDEEEVRQREAKFREVMRPYIEDYEKNWEGVLEKEMMGHYERLKKFDLKNASAQDLWLHVEDCLAVTRRMWFLHVLGMYVTWCPFVLLERLCMQLLGIDDTDPNFLKLITGFDNKLFQVDRRMWLLSKKANELGLKEIFLGSESKDVIPILENSNSGKKWLAEFREFLEEDGWRTQRRDEFLLPTWIEDPTPAIEIIKIFIKKGGEFDPDKHREKAVKEREEAEKRILSRIPDEQKGWFTKLLKVSQKAGPYGESHSYYCEDYCFSLTRMAFLEIARRYVKAGTIDSPDDIFFLLPEEIRKVIYIPQHYNLRPVVKRRRGEWETWCKEPNPPFILKEGVTPNDITQRLIKTADPIFFKALLGVMPRVKPELKADLYGIIGSPGFAEGPARVILEEKDLSQVMDGDILVAVNTAPSWTPVFHLIKGAVIDRGGSLAHASIVGREFGLPIVINVFNGTQMIRTGQQIRVDANLGAVFILDK